MNTINALAVGDESSKIWPSWARSPNCSPLKCNASRASKRSQSVSALSIKIQMNWGSSSPVADAAAKSSSQITNGFFRILEHLLHRFNPHQRGTWYTSQWYLLCRYMSSSLAMNRLIWSCLYHLSGSDEWPVTILYVLLFRVFLEVWNIMGKIFHEKSW